MYLEIADFIIRDYDKSNLVLTQRVPISNPKSPRFGQFKDKAVGYYPNLEMALNRLKNELIARSDVDTVDMLMYELQKIEKMISDALNKTEN